MHVHCLSIGRPAIVVHNGERYSTAINRKPVEGAVALTQFGFEGDRVASAVSHGGPDKAVCCYPHEHFAGWEQNLGREMSSPLAGENLTTTGLLENEVAVGDTFRIGTAVVQVSQPRRPCHKLAHKLGEPSASAIIFERGWSGFYLRVLETGVVSTGDAIELLDHPHPEITIESILRARVSPDTNEATARAFADMPELSESWRKFFANSLSR